MKGLWICLFFPILVQSQYAELVEETRLSNDYHYFFNFQFENQENVFVNQGIICTYLFDSSLAIKGRLKSTCFAKGGATGHLCGPNGLYIVRKRVCEHHHDSIIIFDLAKGKRWGQDLAQPIIEARGLGKGGMPPFLNFYPFKYSNQVLVENHGEFWIYNIDIDRLDSIILDINKPKGWMPDPLCLLLNQDKELLIYTEHGGLSIYNTKTWKKQRTLLAPGQKLKDLHLLSDKQHYCYKIDNTIFVRNCRNHEEIKRFEISDELDEFDVASDLTFVLFNNKTGVYLWQNNKELLMLKSQDYLGFEAIAINPSSTHFVTGVMGNRVLKYKLIKSGSAPESIKKVEVFSYSEKEAEQLATKQILLELALRNLGYTLPLDNIESREDEKLYKQFCKDHGLYDIKSEKALKLLKLDTAD